MNDLRKGQDDHNRQELKLLSRYHTNRDELQRFVVFFPVTPLTQLLNISCQDFFFASLFFVFPILCLIICKSHSTISRLLSPSSAISPGLDCSSLDHHHHQYHHHPHHYHYRRHCCFIAIAPFQPFQSVLV